MRSKLAALLPGVIAAALLALSACQLVPASGAVSTQAVLARTTVLPSTPVSYPTLPPEWTATWTPVASGRPPTPVPSATPAASYSQRLAAAKADINKALSLTNNGQYKSALPLWNKIILAVPEYADAYYERTRCTLNLAAGLNVESDYAAAMQAALVDMNQALDLDSRNGNYFHERQFVYANLALIEPNRVDQDYWAGLALADAQAAVRFGTSIAYADRDVAYRLIDAGQPQQAFDMFSTLPPVKGKTRDTDADLQEGLAESLFAEGFVDEALTHITTSIKLSPSIDKHGEKALMLLSQGQLPEALAEVNLDSAGGVLCGCSYYTRALIYYLQGKSDQAQADITLGTGRTWERGGLRAYVLALIALDKGDTANGTQLLQTAQASLPRSAGPVLLKQIQQKLDELKVKRLDPTPYAGFLETPMPTPP